MGGGKDQKQANAQLKSQHEYQAGQQKTFDTRNTSDLDTSRGRGDELYSQLKSGFSSLAGTGGAPPAAAAGGGGGGGGGGVATPPVQADKRFQEVEDSYRDFLKTGGWSPEHEASMMENVKNFKSLGQGGISPEDMARMRGGGVYDEFSKTGGLSDKDQQNIRSRGTSGIPAMYGQMNQAMQRGRTLQGGYGPGGNVMAQRMAREQAGGMADAALNAELGIKSQVNQGRQWGAQGMTSSEGQLQDILSRNKLGGLQGASDTERQMVESQMGGRQWGTGGLQGMAESDRAAAERAAERAAAAGSEGAAGDRWAQEFGFQQKMAGLEGLGGLYQGEGAGEYNRNKEFALGSAQGYGGEVRDTAMGQKTGNVNPWDNVAKIGGAVAGGLTGLGAIGSAVGAAGQAASKTRMPPGWSGGT